MGFEWFANTDLDLQLNSHGVHQLIVTGLIADTAEFLKPKFTNTESGAVATG